jgi:hypothetical protein
MGAHKPKQPWHAPMIVINRWHFNMRWHAFTPSEPRSRLPDPPALDRSDRHVGCHTAHAKQPTACSTTRKGGKVL